MVGSPKCCFQFTAAILYFTHKSKTEKTQLFKVAIKSQIKRHSCHLILLCNLLARLN